MHGDIRDDWKLAEIEHKAADAIAQVASLRSDVERLESALRESRAEVDGLRARCEELQNFRSHSTCNDCGSYDIRVSN
jgi:chromosome segregation ATPase